ncbi:MAG TPA: hypothetical protein VEX37_15935 [Thermomicrobiales bacterium]|nr:hypothetical protein [Thermomicrobiales bacterium]
MTTLTQLDEMRDDISESTPRVMVAREGTELAEALRASGWVARAGWRTTTTEGQSVWHLRFEVENDDE